MAEQQCKHCGEPYSEHIRGIDCPNGAGSFEVESRCILCMTDDECGVAWEPCTHLLGH